MRRPQFYRYFLGFRPDPILGRLLTSTAREAGQLRTPDFHLTLCVVEEAERRDPFIGVRIEAALAGSAPRSFRMTFGTVSGGEEGAILRTIGRQDGLQDFYDALLRNLEQSNISPLHRRSGLRPHVTLGYAACRFEPFGIAVEWFPEELLLIESEVGNHKHRVLGRWPLLPAPQGELPLLAGPPDLRLAG